VVPGDHHEINTSLTIYTSYTEPHQLPITESLNITTFKMGSEPQYAKYPFLLLSQHIFTITNPSSSKPSQQSSLKSLQDAITEHKMAPLYKYLSHPTEGILNATGEGTSSAPAKNSGRKPSGAGMLASKHSIPKVDLPWDEDLYEKLKKENEEELAGFEKEEEEAAEKAGESEVQAARGKRAEFWARVGDKVLLLVILSHLFTDK
jgi:26S proteasome regulatory subunit N7